MCWPIWDGPVPASIRCVARTTSGLLRRWRLCLTSILPISRWTTTTFAINSENLAGAAARQANLTVTEMVDGILTGQVRGWYVMGENHVDEQANPPLPSHGPGSLVFVAQDIFFNGPTSMHRRDPPAGSEKGRHVYQLRPACSVPPPPSIAPPPDWEIISDLAPLCRTTESRPARISPRTLTISSSSGHTPCASDVWEEMRADARLLRHHLRTAGREGGVHWPCPTPEHPGTPYPLADGFPAAVARFWPVDYGSDGEQPDEDYPFILRHGRVLTTGTAAL